MARVTIGKGKMAMADLDPKEGDVFVLLGGLFDKVYTFTDGKWIGPENDIEVPDNSFKAEPAVEPAEPVEIVETKADEELKEEEDMAGCGSKKKAPAKKGGCGSKKSGKGGC